MADATMVKQDAPEHRGWLGRCRRFVTHSILHADDPPSRLALGAAIAMFVTFTPTVGFQMALAVFLAWLFRANKAIGVPIVWISNPATIVPIFYSCYRLGVAILATEPIGKQWWADLRTPPPDWWERVTFFWNRFLEIFWPMWVGGIAVGLALAYPTYYFVYFTVRSYRLKRWGQLVPPSRETDDNSNGEVMG